MIKNTENRQSGIIVLFIANKYLFICSIFSFLLIASVYLALTPVTYKVATRIVLKTNQAPQEIINNVKSKALLQKVIHQLPLQVAYFQKKSSAETEIPGRLSPVKFIAEDNRSISSSAELKIFVVNDSEYKILKDRVFTYFLFNDPVDLYPFAKFKIVKGPAFKLGASPATIRVYSDDRLLTEYDKNLDVKYTGGDSKSIEISLTANSLKNGRAFLDKLVEVYNVSNGVAVAPEIAVDATPVKIENISHELSLLNSKQEKFKIGRDALLSAEKNSNDRKPVKSAVKEQELNLLDAIEPYAKSSVDQFVLIPYGDEVTDNQLKKLISEFNQVQTDKQHVLQTTPIDNSKISSLRALLSAIKQGLLERINVNKGGLNGSNQVAISETIAMPALKAINDSILKTDIVLKAKQLQYNSLLQSQRNVTERVPAKPQEAVIEKSGEHVVSYPKIGYVYLFALLIGLLLPLIVPYFKLRVNVN